jgi:hypothetical protein
MPASAIRLPCRTIANSEVPPLRQQRGPTGRRKWPIDEALVWRGYGTTPRGVIKLRSGRFVVEINATSVEDAKQFAKGALSSLR